MSDYMTKLQSILTPSEEIEEHFIVNGREIVGEYKHIIVEGDENSNTIYITMNDTFDGQQLYPKNIEIRYTTPDGYVGFDKPEIMHSGSIIRMAWLLDANVSRTHGKVEFSIWVTSEAYEWKTLSTSFTVEKKQEAFGAEAPPPERDWVTKLMTKANTQSDYNQSDDSAKDYIKNRPCCETEGVLGSIDGINETHIPVPVSVGYELKITFAVDRGLNFEAMIRLQEGVTEYRCCGDCVKIVYDGMWLTVHNVSEEQDLPYQGTITVSQITVKPLAERFIPDTIARTKYVNELIGDIDTALDEINAIQKIYIEGANL